MTGTVLIWLLAVWLNDVLFEELTVPVRLLNAAMTTGLAVPLVVLARRYLDRRPWSGLALQPLRRAGRPFLVGVGAFLVPSLLGVWVAVLTGWVDLETTVPVAQVLGWAALLVVLVFFLEALPEELIFRGYLQRNLMTAMAPWMAVVVQAVLFSAFGTLLWVSREGWGVLVERGGMFLLVALVLGLLRLQTGSVWTPIGFHLAFQVVAQTLLGGDRLATDDELALMLAAVVVPFALATTIVRFGHRAGSEPDWSRPQQE